MTLIKEHTECDFCHKTIEQGHAHYVIVPHTISSDKPDEEGEEHICSECKKRLTTEDR